MSDTPVEGINEEADAKAPVTGADPQGESAPDAGTKAESVTGDAPEVSSGATDAEEDVARAVASNAAIAPGSVGSGIAGIQPGKATMLLLLGSKLHASWLIMNALHSTWAMRCQYR